MGGDSAAERLSTDEQAAARKSLASAQGRGNRRAVTGLQPGGSIGNAAALLGVGKIEGDSLDPAHRQSVREADHETARLVRSRTMTEEECVALARMFRGRVGEARDLLFRNGDRESVGHFVATNVQE